jgi:hypothetical protein
VDPVAISKELNSLNQGVINCLVSIDSYDFDIFNLKASSNCRELLILGVELTKRLRIIE